MPKTKISEFSATPANNTDIDSINIAEGCAPSGINDAIRELMAQLKDWQSGTSNDPYVVGSSGSLTLNQGTANGVAYLNGSKVVTSGSALTFDGATLTSTQPSAFTPNATFVQTATVSGVAFVKVQSNSAEIDLMSGGSTYAVNYMGADEAGLVTQGADSMRFNVGGSYARWTFGSSEQMRLTSTGLGIGTSSPAAKLDVSGGSIRVNEDGVGTKILTLRSDYAGLGPAINVTTTDPLLFLTANTERARIDSSGRLLVGTTSSIGTASVGRVQILGGETFVTTNSEAGGFVGVNSNADNSLAIVADLDNLRSGSHIAFYVDGFSERARIDSSGNFVVGSTSFNAGVVGFGAAPNGDVYMTRSETTNSYVTNQIYSTGAGNYRFYVGMAGTVYAASTSISAISDQTLKENIRDLETGLTEVMALKPRRFDWKNGDALNVAGFVAQEVEQVLPELVSDYKYSNTETKKSLKMGDILPTLVKAIQEQQAIIESLKARLDAANL